MKASKRLENIFAHAVAMDNRGMRNTVHCVGSSVYVVNFDHTVIMRFRLRKNEQTFDAPVSFNANDYDSSLFEMDGDRIIFQGSKGGYDRKKICRTADYDADKVKQTFREYVKQGKDAPHKFTLSEEVCSLLEDGLSHVEVSVEDGGLVLRQRNIYSGTIIEVTPKKAGLLSVDELPETFGPVGLKTDDFTALFSFVQSIEFTPVGNDWLIARDHRKRDWDAVIAFCKYDEIINLQPEGEDNGRQEPQVRRSK